MDTDLNLNPQSTWWNSLSLSNILDNIIEVEDGNIYFLKISKKINYS